MIYHHHVFLSYSRKDTAMMQHVRDDLRASGLMVWTDEGLDVGTPSWMQDIDLAIRNTGCLVVLLSPDAYQSEWVGREITFAQTHNKRIFPLLIRGSDTNAIPFQLAGYNYFAIKSDYENGIQMVIASILRYFEESDRRVIITPVSYENTLNGVAGARNPLNWLRLLGWILFNPEQWISYRLSQGKRGFIKVTDEPTSIWLISTLVWLPILWISMGVILGHLKMPVTWGSGYEDALIATFLVIIAWVLTNIRANRQVGCFGGMTLAFLAGVVSAGIGQVLNGELVGSSVLIVAISIPVGISLAMAQGAIIFIALGAMTLAPAGSMSHYQTGIIVLFMIGLSFCLAFAVEFGVKGAIQTQSKNMLTIIIFVALIASHIFLIWYCLLGGYYILN